MTSIALLDYGSGNLHSAFRALARVGADVTLTADPAVAMEADGLVVPGVGAFAACIEGLNAVKGGELISQRVSAGRPVLGICVGMQVLFERSVEFGSQARGVGVWPGVVDRLPAKVLPHMGWNTVRPDSDSVLFRGISTDTRFYFVHSFACQTGFDAKLTWAHHGADFLAAAESGALSATQFHPEKSGDAGAVVLDNWVKSIA